MGIRCGLVWIEGGRAWQVVAGADRTIWEALARQDKACTGSARPNQGHFAQDEPFVSKDKETVGWLECFYIIHFHTLE